MFKPQMWKGKKAGVLGLGKSGQSVALLLHACGIEVFQLDDDFRFQSEVFFNVCYFYERSIADES